MNTTDSLVEHYRTHGFDDLDSETVRRTKLRILDSFGIMLAGKSGIGCKPVFDLLLRKGGAQEATVIGYNEKLPAFSAALINSLMARSYDFGPVMAVLDSGQNKPAHISECTEPAAIAAAEYNESCGKDLIYALAIGDDLAARLVGFSGGGPQDVFDNTGTASGMGAVVACAKLYNLNAKQYKNAIGIMMNSIAGSMSNSDEYSMSFKYPIANAAHHAILSTELAQAGFECVDEPLFGRKGYFDIYGANHDTEHFFDSFGKSYLSDIVIKPWPSCRMTHAGIDAILKATSRKPLDPEAIETIQIYLHPKAPGFVIDAFEFGDTSQVHAAFNLRFTSAMAILHGTVRPEHFAPDNMRDPRVDKVLQALSFDRDPALASPNTARAKIVLKDGSELVGRVEQTPLGDFLYAPLSENAITEKFLLNASFGEVSSENARAAAASIMNLENIESLDGIISKLR